MIPDDPSAFVALAMLEARGATTKMPKERVRLDVRCSCNALLIRVLRLPPKDRSLVVTWDDRKPLKRQFEAKADGSWSGKERAAGAYEQKTEYSGPKDNLWWPTGRVPQAVWLDDPGFCVTTRSARCGCGWRLVVKIEELRSWCAAGQRTIRAPVHLLHRATTWSDTP